MGDNHPGRLTEEERRELWAIKASQRSAANMRTSKERYESWLYDAIEQFERLDPAHRADYPAHDKPERLLRTLCRVVERLLPVGTTADDVAAALAVETELERR